MRNGHRLEDFPTWREGMNWRDYVAAYERVNHLIATVEAKDMPVRLYCPINRACAKQDEP